MKAEPGRHNAFVIWHEGIPVAGGSPSDNDFLEVTITFRRSTLVHMLENPEFAHELINILHKQTEDYFKMEGDWNIQE